jgi:phage tail tape-measure protein
MHDMVHENEWGGDMVDVTQRCANCRSARVEPRNYAQRLGGAIGAIAGSTSGIALALTGMEIGLLGGPVGAVLGGMAGVVIEGIVGGATGCAAGSKLGAAIDRNILHNQLCLDCGHTSSDRS